MLSSFSPLWERGKTVAQMNTKTNVWDIHPNPNQEGGQTGAQNKHKCEKVMYKKAHECLGHLPQSGSSKKRDKWGPKQT